MRAAKLYLCDSPDSDAELEEYYDDSDPDRLPARTVEKTVYQDQPIGYVGWAAGRTSDGGEVVSVNTHDELSISREVVPDATEITVATQYVADPAEGIIGIDRSDAEFAADAIAGEWGTAAVEAEVRLDEWIEQEAVRAGTAWNETVSDPVDGARIDYHDRATTTTARNDASNLSMYGYEYRSDVAGHVKGVIAQSGYVAVHGEMRDAIWLQWLREEVAPYLRIADEDLRAQQVFGAEGGAEADD